jgi:hypothetical protein
LTAAQKIPHPVRRLFSGFLLLALSAINAAAAPQSVILRGNVADEDGKPVAGLEVQIQTSTGEVSTVYTDVAGAFEFSSLAAGECQLSFSKIGFFRLDNQRIRLSDGVNEGSFTVNHETEIHTEVEVYSSSESIRPLDTSHSEDLIAREIRDIPVSSTHDLRSSLQTLPEVVRDQAGQLHIAGGRVGETQYLLDGFDIGDPVTGNFSVRVNIDSVRDVEVESARYSAQYGNAGAGVLDLNTATGDDRWRASATNFIPGISAERGIHLTSWYPRFTLSGPLRKERAWFYEALGVQNTLSLIEDLPRDADSVSQWAGDNMLRTQIRINPRNLLQVSYLYNQRNASNLGLGPFSPIETTRDLGDYRSFIAFKEQVWSGRTFYELGIAADYGHSESLPHGFEPYRLTPEGSSGNYFESLRQKTRRWQGVASVTMPTRHWHGTHDIQFGFNASELGWTHTSGRNAIEVVRSDETVAQHTDFSGSPSFYLTNVLAGAYGDDVWHIVKAVVLHTGIRIDWDRIVGRATPSPRISVNFLPFSDDRVKLTASWGIFLQPVTLSTLGPAYDQERSDVFYGQPGLPPVYGPVSSSFVLPNEALKQPRFYAVSLGVERRFRRNTSVEFNFTRRQGRFGLAYEKTASVSDEQIYVLRNNRRDSYQSFQISFQHSFSDKASVSGSYTRSSARTNQVFDYSLDTLVFTPQEPGPLPWDAPNRLISSGWTPIPVWRLFFSYFFEYRTGFPFSVVNELQQLEGPANYERFPEYASLNLGIEKRIRLFKREWAIRLTVLNVTGHSNPNGVINNVDSPNFMKFSGGQKRAYSARIRIVG